MGLLRRGMADGERVTEIARDFGAVKAVEAALRSVQPGRAAAGAGRRNRRDGEFRPALPGRDRIRPRDRPDPGPRRARPRRAPTPAPRSTPRPSSTDDAALTYHQDGVARRPSRSTPFYLGPRRQRHVRLFSYVPFHRAAGNNRPTAGLHRRTTIEPRQTSYSDSRCGRCDQAR